MNHLSGGPTHNMLLFHSLVDHSSYGPQISEEMDGNSTFVNVPQMGKIQSFMYIHGS